MKKMISEIWGELGHAHIQNLEEIYTVLLKITFVLNI